MTLAQIFNYTLNTDYHQAQRTVAGKVAMIKANPVLAIRTDSEAREIVEALKCPPDILDEANHMFTLELSIAASFINCGNESWQDAGRYIARGLLNGYSRRTDKGETRLVLEHIVKEFPKFRHLSLNKAIAEALPAAQAEHQEYLARKRDERDRAEREEEERRNAASTIERLRKEIADLKERCTEKDEVNRALNIQLRKAQAPAIDRTESLQHAQANKVMLIEVYMPGERVPTRHYAHTSELENLQLFLNPRVQGDESCCQLCTDRKATESCGNEKCGYEMCIACFHKWFRRNAECPGCRRGYIPATAREQVPVPTATTSSIAPSATVPASTSRTRLMGLQAFSIPSRSNTPPRRSPSRTIRRSSPQRSDI